MSNQSKCWNMSENLKSIKCWYFIAKVWINQNVGIWLENKELIRILKLIKIDIENDQIWVLITKSYKMLYFEWKVGNQSKSWRLSAIRWELIKMLKFECKMSNRSKCWNLSKKGGDWSNVDILLQKWKSIKLLEIAWKIRNWSEYWNLRTTLRINQNVEIWVQNVKSIKMLKFEWKRKIDQNVKIWVKRGNQ